MGERIRYFKSLVFASIFFLVTLSGCNLPGNISLRGEIPKYLGIEQKETPPPGVVPSAEVKKVYGGVAKKREAPAISFSNVVIPSNPDNKCDSCHSNMKMADQAANIAFSHEKHLSLAEHIKGCLSCHQSEPHGKKKTKGVKPGICKQCHQTEYPHLSGWNKKHGKDYEKNSKGCLFCHTDYKKYCIGCHGTLMPHPLSWRSTHSSQKSTSCKKCHPGGNFCTSCHHKTYVSSLTDWKGQHPSVVKARGSFNCFGCHKPTYCSYCHIHGQVQKTPSR